VLGEVDRLAHRQPCLHVLRQHREGREAADQLAPGLGHLRVAARFGAGGNCVIATAVMIANAARADECQKWANKAEALASCAKQAHDTALRKMADRIQARAIRRCGELLKQIKPARGGDRKSKGPHRPVDSRSSAAAQADMSPRQRKTALRVANVPKAEFEKAVESPNPAAERRRPSAGR
jgi:hypothetical protein